jgi:hypothetical protein
MAKTVNKTPKEISAAIAAVSKVAARERREPHEYSVLFDWDEWRAHAMPRSKLREQLVSAGDCGPLIEELDANPETILVFIFERNRYARTVYLRATRSGTAGEA